MKVTIVIPAHNEEGIIASCIKASQSIGYSDLEIIVVDNASTDQTFEVASSHGVKVIKEHRKGTLWARQCGLENATGDLVAFVDADCLPDRSWFDSVIKNFDNPHVVGVSGPYLYYDAPRIQKAILFAGMKWLYSTVNQLQSLTGTGGVSIGGNTIVRREKFLSAGGFNTSIEFWGDDIDTAIRLSKIGKLVYGREVVMKTSYRRFRNEGFANLIVKYMAHFLKCTKKNSASSKKLGPKTAPR